MQYRNRASVTTETVELTSESDTRTCTRGRLAHHMRYGVVDDQSTAEETRQPRASAVASVMDDGEVGKDEARGSSIGTTRRTSRLEERRHSRRPADIHGRLFRLVLIIANVDSSMPLTYLRDSRSSTPSRPRRRAHHTSIPQGKRYWSPRNIYWCSVATYMECENDDWGNVGKLSSGAIALSTPYRGHAVASEYHAEHVSKSRRRPGQGHE